MTKHDLETTGPRADRPKRRRFTAEYKLQILQGYDTAPKGEKGAILRREGLYDSSIQLWRKQRNNGALKNLDRTKNTADSEHTGRSSARARSSSRDNGWAAVASSRP